MARELNMNFRAYKSCESVLQKALFFCNTSGLSKNSAFEGNALNPYAQKIKNNLRSTSQKMFLYDIITQTSSIDSNIKAEANALLGNLLKAENTFDKSEIMDNIDKFSERYTKELKKL